MEKEIEAEIKWKKVSLISSFFVLLAVNFLVIIVKVFSIFTGRVK